MLILRNTILALRPSRLFSHPSLYNTSHTICDMSPGVESPAKRHKMEVDGVDNDVVMHERKPSTTTETQPVLKFARLSEDAYDPVRGSDHAAGFDLKSAKDMVVKAKDKALVPTDIQIALPEGCYGRIAPRSGLSWKKFIDVGAGVIDRDYRGNVRVLLFNFSNEDFQVEKGERIAQLICERIFMPTLEACDTLDETKRGEGGFGSTGTK